ncbi:MAG: AAA family ATPase [Clostridia bacterium]|nr:AAA family ATPase [Clostridia bacterium]
MKKQEIAVGLAAAVVVFLFANGINIVPLLFLGGLLALAVRAGLPGLERRFTVVGQDGRAVPSVTFDDVGGQETAKKELMEALDFVSQEDRVRQLGIRPLKGILLTGPPGTGKTLLAKAAANYTASVFLAASGSEFIEMYAGVGAQRVRELFRRAREQARRLARRSAIIFIDEIEVLGGRRGRHQSHLEYDQTLNQLLVEMDGITLDDDVRVLVVGATNRADLLDEALLRPGRFDRVVRVDLPDREGRRQILDLHTRNKPLRDVDLDAIARETFGFSGAHLENLANEAAILAMREQCDCIEQRHFLEAIDKVILGERLDRKPSREELYRIAVHEAGHAIVGEVLRPGSVAAITITSRGQALGYVRQAPQDDLYLYTRDYLEDEICRCLAGSAAEKLLLGTASTGAAADFDQALALAERMVFAGMTSLGVVGRDTVPQALLHRALTEVLAAQEERATRVLAERRAVLEDVAGRLVEEERLDGDEVRRALSAVTVRAS